MFSVRVRVGARARARVRFKVRVRARVVVKARVRIQTWFKAACSANTNIFALRLTPRLRLTLIVPHLAVSPTAQLAALHTHGCPNPRKGVSDLAMWQWS